MTAVLESPGSSFLVQGCPVQRVGKAVEGVALSSNLTGTLGGDSARGDFWSGSNKENGPQGRLGWKGTFSEPVWPRESKRFPESATVGACTD